MSADLIAFLIISDQTSLSQIGVNYTYSVTVVDRKGVRSSGFTCGNTHSAVVSSSGIDYVVVLLVLIGVLFIPLLIASVERCRYHMLEIFIMCL